MRGGPAYLAPTWRLPGGSELVGSQAQQARRVTSPPASIPGGAPAPRAQTEVATRTGFTESSFFSGVGTFALGFKPELIFYAQ